ncbi:hypothetical protein C9426_19675 [Serratia sp. S1B]|nr:hypothetical protein C9426_19675 [Serratia sp. S1B]
MKLSPSGKIANGIISIIISISIFFFIAYSMKIMIVFIKYYMQLISDYENQRLSFILSNGNLDEFTKTLNNLRAYNIGFDKTPSMPQEKIILSLIEAVGLAKSKSKGES